MEVRKFVVCCAVAAGASVTATAAAEENGACASITRANLVSCVLGSSLALESERWGGAAAKGRLAAASTILPSNPVLGLEAKRRTSDTSDHTATNWSASLSQEIELGGERGARRASALAEIDAQKWRMVATTREVAASGWTAYFNVLAAQQEEQIAQRLEAISVALAHTAHGRAEQGIGTPMDADLAEFAAVRATQARTDAERQLRTSELSLTTLLGSRSRAPHFRISGELVPLDGAFEFASKVSDSRADRPEIKALQAEQRANLARATVLRRSRVPNVTVSVFAERDGFDERTFGLGLAVPLPLPHPLGQSHSGEIAEAEALAQRSSTEANLKARDLRGSLAIALGEYESRGEALREFTPERIARADQTLRDIASEIEQGRVAVRDALVTEQMLIDFIESHLEARRALCLASVQLATAAGFPFERGLK